MLIKMQLVLYYFSSVTMVCILSHTIVANMLWQNATMGGVEKELLAVFLACVKWQCYINGVPTTTYTDHELW